MLPPQPNNPTSDRPRRRVVVNASHQPLNPHEVAAVRQGMVDNLPPPNNGFNDLGDGDIPRFDPQEARNFQPPVNNRPSPKPPTVDDVAAAFARAGQPARVNNPQRSSPHPQPQPPQQPTPTNNAAPPRKPTPPADALALLNVLRISEPISDHPLAFRELLPSNSVFYANSLEVRPFEVPEYAKLYRARAENDESILIDVMDAVCGVDVRDLTVKDLRYLMYKLRMNSSLKAPYTLSYTTMYGNRCEFSINDSNLRVKILEATPEEFEEWHALGLTMPTVRDQEEFNMFAPRLGREGEFLWRHAKYVQGSGVADKIRALQRYPTNFLFDEIQRFSLKFEDYGVTESIELQDNKFDPPEALNYLRNALREVEAGLVDRAINPLLTQTLLEQREELTAEIERIATELSNTGEAAPKRETIPFSIEIADFFPGV